VDLPNDAVPLVTGVICEQLAEQVITSLNSNRVNCGRFYELHLDGGNFKFSPHLVLRGFLLRNLGELLKIFEELLLIHGSDVKRRTEILLAQDANVNLNPLQVRLCVAWVVHQFTSELVADGQPGRDTVWLGDPRGVLELRVTDGGLLSDLPAFTVPVLDVIQFCRSMRFSCVPWMSCLKLVCPAHLKSRLIGQVGHSALSEILILDSISGGTLALNARAFLLL
jgi:hypothetical protein